MAAEQLAAADSGRAAKATRPLDSQSFGFTMVNFWDQFLDQFLGT